MNSFGKELTSLGSATFFIFWTKKLSKIDRNLGCNKQRQNSSSVICSPTSFFLSLLLSASALPELNFGGYLPFTFFGGAL